LSRSLARTAAERAAALLGVSLEEAAALSLGDTEAYMYTGGGYELTIRCGPCGCEAMLRGGDEPLAYCGRTCSPDPRARRRREALEAAKALEAALESAGAPRLRDC